jgi:hypothetical protein
MVLQPANTLRDLPGRDKTGLVCIVSVHGTSWYMGLFKRAFSCDFTIVLLIELGTVPIFGLSADLLSYEDRGLNNRLAEEQQIH